MALDQAAYRFGGDDGTESTHSFLAAQNTAIDRLATDASSFLCRILLQASGGVVHSNVFIQWQYRKNAGAWTNITTTSANLKAVTSSVIANQGNATNRLGGTGTFESSAQSTTWDGLTGGSACDIVSNGCCETVCALQLVPADLVATDVLEIRVIDGTSVLPFTSYSVTPQINVTGVAAGAGMVFRRRGGVFQHMIIR
jgi:hypothetical protein